MGMVPSARAGTGHRRQSARGTAVRRNPQGQPRSVRESRSLRQSHRDVRSITRRSTTATPTGTKRDWTTARTVATGIPPVTRGIDPLIGTTTRATAHAPRTRMSIARDFGRATTGVQRRRTVRRFRRLPLAVLRTPSGLAFAEATADNLRLACRPVAHAALAGVSEGWRRGRDSNPRYPFGYSGFQDRRHQPLGHLSAHFSLLAFVDGPRRSGV